MHNKEKLSYLYFGYLAKKPTIDAKHFFIA